MAIYTTSADTSTQIVANTVSDVWIVQQGVYVTTTLSAIDGSGSNGNKTFLIDGSLISSAIAGIVLGNTVANDGGFNQVYISQTGAITASSSGVASAGGFLTFINDGMINAFDGTGVYAEDSYNSLTNNGTISATSRGMYATGGNNSLTNNGNISSQVTGMSANGGDNNLTNNGNISTQDTGMAATLGNNSMANRGTISTQNVDAVGMYALSGGNNFLSNSGEISMQGANSYGIASGSGTGNRLINSGEIGVRDTTANAVKMDSSAGEETRLVNTGLLSAPDIAVFGGAGNEIVINRGTIDGSVDLGAGDDIFRGKDGLVNGEVRGGAGSDTLVGSKIADDNLLGNSGADTLNGKNGDDVLSGGSGQDTLIGGKGDDDLRGGGGADIFVFKKNQGNDVIQDFVNGQDKLDLSGFGFKSKSQALAKFYELGSATNDKLAFDFKDTSIIIKGIDMADLNNADIII